MVTSENMFDDNYAFYMYYLNTSGQLVTPVEQMFHIMDIHINRYTFVCLDIHK